MTGGKKRIARATAGAVLLLSPGAALAESRLELSTSLAVSASDNPLLLSGSTPSALMAEGTVSPSWLLEDGGAKTRLGSSLTVRRYSRAYEKYTYGSARLEREERLSEAFSYKGSVSYDRSVTVDVLDDVAAAVDPTSLRNKIAADASLRWRPGPRGEWNAGMSYERVSFEDATVLRNYRAMGLDLGYSHALSEATRVGVQARAGLNRSKTLSDVDVLGLMATIEHRLGPVWTLTAAVGAEHVTSSGSAVAGSIGGTFASGEIELCRKGAYLDFCGSAALASQASGVGEVQRRLSLKAQFDYRLSERTTFSLTGNLERPVGNSARVGGGIEPRYLQLRADIGRRLSETLTVRAYSSYRRRESFDKVDAGYIGVELRWTPRLS